MEKSLQVIEAKLTALKAWSIAEGNPTGFGKADLQIRAIQETLNALGYGFRYALDGVDHWKAIIYKFD